MLSPLTSVLTVLMTAQVVTAADGRPGPARWLLEEREVLVGTLPSEPPANDPLSRLIEHCKRRPVGLRPLLTLVPTASDDEAGAERPTLAIVARAHGRTIVSLTRVRAEADAGQEVVMQRTVVSDLLAGRRFALTVYEDHALGEAAFRLMGVGARVTFRPALVLGGWRFRMELLASTDLAADASAYLSITGVLDPPPLPPR